MPHACGGSYGGLVIVGVDGQPASPAENLDDDLTVPAGSRLRKRSLAHDAADGTQVHLVELQPARATLDLQGDGDAGRPSNDGAAQAALDAQDQPITGLGKVQHDVAGASGDGDPRELQVAQVSPQARHAAVELDRPRHIGMSATLSDPRRGVSARRRAPAV
jgi:hypothetical protein